MEITNVRVRVADDNSGNLVGFASITIDNALMIHDIRIIKTNSRYFVAMPSRKVTDHCASCNAKNALQSNYCHMCGNKLGAVPRNEVSKFHVDVAHPVNPEAREMIERTIIESYLEELAEQKTRAASIPEIDRLSA